MQCNIQGSFSFQAVEIYSTLQKIKYKLLNLNN